MARPFEIDPDQEPIVIEPETPKMPRAERRRRLVARLGRFIHLLCSVLAGVMLGLVLFNYASGGKDDSTGHLGALLLMVFFALMVWLIGRAALYILADR